MSMDDFEFEQKMEAIRARKAKELREAEGTTEEASLEDDALVSKETKEKMEHASKLAMQATVVAKEKAKQASVIAKQKGKQASEIAQQKAKQFKERVGKINIKSKITKVSLSQDVLKKIALGVVVVIVLSLLGWGAYAFFTKPSKALIVENKKELVLPVVKSNPSIHKTDTKVDQVKELPAVPQIEKEVELAKEVEEASVEVIEESKPVSKQKPKQEIAEQDTKKPVAKVSAEVPRQQEKPTVKKGATPKSAPTKKNLTNNPSWQDKANNDIDKFSDRF